MPEENLLPNTSGMKVLLIENTVTSLCTINTPLRKVHKCRSHLESLYTYVCSVKFTVSVIVFVFSLWKPKRPYITL